MAGRRVTARSAWCPLPRRHRDQKALVAGCRGGPAHALNPASAPGQDTTSAPSQDTTSAPGSGHRRRAGSGHGRRRDLDRAIPITDWPHVDDDPRLWMDNARGRWDRDTLVVETRNFNDRGMIASSGSGGRMKGIPVNAALHVAERFTRVSEDEPSPSRAARCARDAAVSPARHLTERPGRDARPTATRARRSRCGSAVLPR